MLQTRFTYKVSRLPVGRCGPHQKHMTPTFFRDRIFYFLLLAPLPFWCALYLFGNGAKLNDFWPLFNVVLLYPLMEELLFRGILQPILSKKFHRRWWLISSANLMTSLIFVAAHFINHPPLWALATFLPSLVFGYMQERSGNVAAPIILHCAYNAGYFLVLDHALG